MEQRHDRAYIRKMAKKHARRSKRILNQCIGSNFDVGLNWYSKNKIYCSCPLCREKRIGNRFNCLSISERRKIAAMEEQLLDF